MKCKCSLFVLKRCDIEWYSDKSKNLVANILGNPTNMRTLRK